MRRIIGDALVPDVPDSAGRPRPTRPTRPILRSRPPKVRTWGWRVNLWLKVSAESAAEGRYRVQIELLSDIWLAALVAWISGVESDDSVLPKLEQATRILFA